MKNMIIRAEKISKNYKIRNKGGSFVERFFDKTYDIKHAVNQIDMHIEEGEIVGFIGPNGAGKSTTIKMLTGILQPDEGEILVNGLNPGKERVKNAKNIGVVFGQRTQLWWDIPLIDTLHLMKYMYDIPADIYKENLTLYTELLGLKEFLHQPVRQLSLGQRMRADIACAILHNPKILYLDEPTIGLDIFAKESVRKFVKEINDQKKTTVLLTTHDMNDIQKLCNRVMVIDKGTIIYEGSLEEIKEKYGFNETVEARGNWNDEVLEKIVKFPSVSTEKKEDKLLIHFDNRKVNTDDILYIILQNKQLRDIKVHEQELDKIIQHLYLEAK